MNESEPSEASLQTLESYLTESIHQDRADIAAIDVVLLETAATLKDASFGSHWPYEARRGKPLIDKGLSQSTNAMMIHAIDLLNGAAHPDAAQPRYPFKIEDELKEDLETIREASYTALSAKIFPAETPSPDPKRKGKLGPSTYSRTYGTNDPLTLSFLADIHPVTRGGNPDPLQAFIIDQAKALLAIDPSRDADAFFKFRRSAQKDGRQPLSNAFVPLRIIRAAKSMGVDVGGYSDYYRYFEGTLHDQLSFHSIPDSRFDPAELVFCLEGVLLTAEQPVQRALFDRTFDVLKAAQGSSTNWRATKPFLRDERGMVLFPVSVEAANSLLRSCEILDRWPPFEEATQKYVELLRLFWEWLRTRRMSFSCTKGDVSINVAGWHSEHINDPDSVQLWDTAQVVEFLLGFRRRLHLFIAATTLRLSRFDVRPITKARLPWSEGTRAHQSFSSPDASAPSAFPRKSGYKPAATMVEQYEPVNAFPIFRVYKKIERDFINGWLNGKPDNYSMLLYGPPGTGKTTVAENIADALKFRMITITVSDFLVEGGGDVEARAKMIFDVLEAQSDCVVLFDEIDELVLDRSSERHRSQDTVFKFMTPGMLTKLNNLRRKKRLIFVLATNYAYRIDPAIRRAGRIDENYLLLPPDEAARRRMLGDLLEDAATRGKVKLDEPLHPETISAADLETLSKHAFFLGYKDIETAIGRALRSDNRSVNALKEGLTTWGRTTTLRFYQAGFDEGADVDAVEAEFLPLVLLTEKEGANVVAEHGSLSLEIFVSEMHNLAEARRRIPHYQDQSEITSAANAGLLRPGPNGTDK